MLPTFYLICKPILLITIAAVFFGSFFEYAIHRFIMHDPRLRNAVSQDKESESGIYHNHATLHHGVFYKRFDLENDPVGKELNIAFTWDDTARVLLLLIPALIAIAYVISPAVAAAFVFVAIAHNRTWNMLHSEMHIPTYAWWTKTSVYRFLARHHYMHHQKTGSNFNVVLPLADFVFATTATPSKEHLVEMYRLGFLPKQNA